LTISQSARGNLTNTTGCRDSREEGSSLAIHSEGRPAEVALADHPDRKRPDDAEGVVVVAVARRRLRRIKGRDLIGDLGIVGQGLKAVCEAFRDIDCAPVLVGEFKPLPSELGG
jgi:hypothetical protein